PTGLASVSVLASSASAAVVFASTGSSTTSAVGLSSTITAAGLDASPLASTCFASIVVATLTCGGTATSNVDLSLRSAFCEPDGKIGGIGVSGTAAGAVATTGPLAAADTAGVAPSGGGAATSGAAWGFGVLSCHSDAT